MRQKTRRLERGLDEQQLIKDKAVAINFYRTHLSPEALQSCDDRVGMEDYLERLQEEYVRGLTQNEIQ